MMQPQQSSVDVQLRQLQCNPTEVVMDALAFIAIQTTCSNIDQQLGRESSDVIAPHMLDRQEFDAAIELKNELGLIAEFITNSPTQRGLTDVLDTIKGQESLVLKALEALEVLCNLSNPPLSC